MAIAEVVEPRPPRSYVYFIRAGEDGPIKIGIAFNPYLRLDELQTGNPYRLRLIGARPGGLADERGLHRTFAADRLEGEWFKPTEALLALVARHEPPTEAAVLSRGAARWGDLARHEHLLERVINEAKSEGRRQNPILCRDDLWRNKYKPALTVINRSAEFMELAREQVRQAIAPCRPYCRCKDDETSKG